MHTLSGRRTALIAASVATVLLFMQLRAEGAAGYDLGDVLSIAVAVLPVLLHGARLHVTRRPSREPGTDEITDAAVADPRNASPVPDQSDGVLTRLLSNSAAALLAGISWLLTVGLVVLQAWPAALSALIIFLVAAWSITPAPSAARESTIVGGSGDRP